MQIIVAEMAAHILEVLLMSASILVHLHRLRYSNLFRPLLLFLPQPHLRRRLFRRQ